MEEVEKQVSPAEGSVYECPQNEWFKFKRCGVKTCKNFTTKTVSGCIGIDRVRPEGSKIISDAEIHLYKFQDEGITTRLVQIKRKTAIDRIKIILILQKYVAWLKATYTGGAVFNISIMLEAERTFPLKIKRLGWENWMWEYFIDEKVWEEFCRKSGIKDSEFSQGQLLYMKATRYEKLVSIMHGAVVRK